MIDRLRLPLLALSFAIDRLRTRQMARSIAPAVPWVIRGLFLVAFVSLLLWMSEVSPQRVTIADLAGGRIGPSQSWIIVSGDLRNEIESTSGGYLYRLTDAAAPDAELNVRSGTRLALGPTTVSGRVQGGRDPQQPGYHWSAELAADPHLAKEQPPPFVAIFLAGVGLLIVIARRTTYPWFLSEAPGPAAAGPARLPVVAHGVDGASGVRNVEGTLDVEAGSATATLRLDGRGPIRVRLYSAFTSLDVGILLSLSSAVPALRLLALGEKLTVGFASRQDRDAAFASLYAGARPSGSRTSAA